MKGPVVKINELKQRNHGLIVLSGTIDVSFLNDINRLVAGRKIMSTIKMRSKESNGLVTVKALIKHPMETGARKNKKTGELIPAHFIQEVHSKANGRKIWRKTDNY